MNCDILLVLSFFIIWTLVYNILSVYKDFQLVYIIHVHVISFQQMKADVELVEDIDLLYWICAVLQWVAWVLFKQVWVWKKGDRLILSTKRLYCRCEKNLREIQEAVKQERGRQSIWSSLSEKGQNNRRYLVSRKFTTNFQFRTTKPLLQTLGVKFILCSTISDSRK